MKIAHLSSVHTAFDTRIFLKECRTLAAEGHEVVFVVPHEGAASRDGVRINAVPLPANRRLRIRDTVRAVYRAALAENADVYHFHDSELIPVGMLLRAGGKRVVYDAHEDLPADILAKEWVPPALRRLIACGANLTEKAGAALFSGIITATPHIAQRFPEHKTVAVQNFPLTQEFSANEGKPYAHRPPQVTYIGNMTEVRGLAEIVSAMAHVPPHLGARLCLAGIFDEDEFLHRLQADSGWQHTEFLGFCSRLGVRDLLSSVRAGLVTFHPIPNHTEAQPNKLFEYMSAGIPLIASDFPLWRKMISEVGCGLLVNPLDPKDIARAIEWVLTNPEQAEAMGRRGREAVLSCYNWESESRKLVDFYARLGDGSH